MNRTDHVYLDPAMPRCTAMAGCAEQRECARRMATIAQGSPLGDYSFNRIAGDPCKWFEPIKRKPAVEPERPSVKPFPEGEG